MVEELLLGISAIVIGWGAFSYLPDRPKAAIYQAFCAGIIFASFIKGLIK